jgi:predicted transcriptional regulator YheO
MAAAKIEVSEQKLCSQLEMMKPIVMQIAETFGANCEVVLHDLTHPSSSVVMTANGDVTGRRIGQPIIDMMQILRSPLFKDDHLSDYMKVTPDGRTIKCSTSVIRDNENNIIGALCINYDLRHHIQNKLYYDEFCQLIDLNNTESKDNNIDVNVNGIGEIANYLIDRAIIETGIPVANMTKEDKIRIVRFLNERETFNIKGTVELLALKLSVSRYTIYNYLSEIAMYDNNSGNN